MNKSIKNFARTAAAGALVALAQSAQSQWVFTGNAYQNSTVTENANYNFASGPGTTQAGNEIVLAGPSALQFLTSFSFQYDFGVTAGGSTSTAGATADLIFYANNGTPLVAGYSPPGTVLYNSGPFALGGFTTGATENFYPADLGGGVLVPKDFTWTVTFSGLSADQYAGLALYGPTPTVGANHGDAWVNTTGTWDLDAAVGPDVASFGAVANVPDSSCLPVSVLSVMLALGWMKRFQRQG
jgi:hypothetical protein